MATRPTATTERRTAASTEYGYGYFADLYASSRGGCLANAGPRDAEGRCKPCEHYACSRQCDGGGKR